jgi:hypothetical protein
MKYQEYKDNVRLENKIIIIISDLEMIGIKINKMDRLLLKESNESDKISDKLLALQRIAQLIEKQEK